MERLIINAEAISDKMQLSQMTKDLLQCKYLLQRVSSYLDMLSCTDAEGDDAFDFADDERRDAQQAAEVINLGIYKVDGLIMASGCSHLLDTDFQMM